MRIVVLSGSPKGDLSITLQYVRFVQKKYPQHDFRYHHIARDLPKIESDAQRFAAIIDDVRGADLVLWSFPVYFLLVHAHYKRFIELILKRRAEAAFAGKYALALATSVHFYDHTALQYMRAICDDLGMRFIDSFPADMQDLLDAEQRRRLLLFADHALGVVEQRQPTFAVPRSIQSASPVYRPGPAPVPVDPGGKKVLILCDVNDPDGNLARMVARLQTCFGGRAETVNIRDLRLESGCRGCVQCAYDNRCPLEARDAFASFYRQRVMTADILIYAGDIRDRYLSARWKTFFDRTFFLGHTPSIKGKQVGIVIAGPLDDNPHLRQILEAYCEVMQANLVAMVGDECGDSAVIDTQLALLARRLTSFCARDQHKPQTFLGVAGHKVLRDEIWGRLRFPFAADHRYFKARGCYDFPHRRWRLRLKNALLLLLVKIPPLRDQIYRRRMQGEMVKLLRKEVEKA